ncbi:hypothetical protein V6N12_023181 [Hibiscus sabdariffa]|uniref:Disease resistance protein RGA3 n=1 Tax=Hibiscus sabdariffa TaxID=183260 RepID=A0ABR2FXS3_9ROSI
MAEAIAFDIAAGLITKLSSLALPQIGLWWNFKDDLDDLKSTVSAIKAVLLDAEEQSVTSNLVKDWLEKLKDALYDADDLLDDFSTEALRKDLISGNKLTKEVRVFFSSSNQFAYGLKMGSKIKAIKARLTSVGCETKMLNLIERDRPVETPFMAKRKQRAHSFVRKDEIIGRDNDKALLLKLILEFETEENAFVIPIVGFGGLGKTALAQLVYNDEMVKDHFELRLWVCVSDTFDLKLIVENIIKSVTNHAPNQNLEMDQLQNQLREKIDGKKYLLVLDDVWNEEREQWFNLKKLLMGGAKGSRIIVTTRSRRVANITSKCEPHVMKGLSDDDAWFLFKEIVFENRYADSTNLAFVEIGKQILARCGGVPLVIRTIAGFVKKPNPNQSLEEIGFGYFKDLVESSFFQEVEGDEYWGMTCKMHDLVHDLAEAVAGRESCILDSNSSTCEVDENCRHISIKPSLIPSLKGKKLRTLLRFPNKGYHNTTDDVIWDSILSSCRCLRVLELYRLDLDTVSHSIHKLKHLRYLDLSYNYNLKILPKSVCKIQNLQVLKLDSCWGLEELPKKIANLVNLTHLVCAGCWRLTHMPSGIGKLTSLQRLPLFVVDRDGSHGAAADLSELSGLNNLRGELRITNLGFVKNAKKEFTGASLKEKQHLQSLTLEWSPNFDDDGDGNNPNDEEKSLEDLQPHPTLKRLCVCGWRGDAKIPTWLSLLTNLVNIEIRGPSKFKHLPSFAQLAHLKLLIVSKLTELEYMDDSDPNGIQGDSESFFPSLTSLWLEQCLNLKSWWKKRPIDDHNNDDSIVIGTSTMAFPRLSSLWIEDCPLTSMPLYPSLNDRLILVKTSSRPLKQTIQMSITNMTATTSSLPLSKLKSFHVENIKELEPDVLDECLLNKPLSGWLQQLTSLKSLKIKDCMELDLEGLHWEPLKNLSRLEIVNTPQLVSLPLWIQHLVQLKTLEIENCSGLRSLFPVFRQLTYLETLRISNCNELELSSDGIQIFQHHTSLHVLHLENIPNCRQLQLPEWLQHLTNLKCLRLINLLNLTSLPDEMRCLTTLQELHINQNPQLEERCGKDIGADWHKIAHIPEIWVNEVGASYPRNCFIYPLLQKYSHFYFQHVGILLTCSVSSDTGAIATVAHLSISRIYKLKNSSEFLSGQGPADVGCWTAGGVVRDKTRTWIAGFTCNIGDCSVLEPSATRLGVGSISCCYPYKY